MKKSFLQMVYLLLFGMIVTLFASCTSGSSSGGSSPGPGPVTQKDTTVLVYILGTDLENNHKAPESGSATANITEMMKVGSTANMNVVIQTGGANRLESQSLYGIKWQNAQRWYVEHESLGLVADLGPDRSVDMGTESALQAFIQWGVQTYPAKKYILVLWDHGGGPNIGMGSDEITKSIISTPSILKAVSSANTKFEIIGFDECLMGSGEIASGLMPSASYMVGSEDIEPGAGWDYTPFLAYVTANPTANGAQIGKVIVDSYAAKMNKDKQVYTLSVIQLDKMQAVIDTTDAFSLELLKYTQGVESWEQIAIARLHSLDYQTSAFFDYATYDLVDMKQFVGNVARYIGQYIGPDQKLATASDAVSGAVTSAVIYESSNYSNLGSTGLTVYFPSLMYFFESKQYAQNTTSLTTGKAYFAARYTESGSGLVYVYNNFFESNQTSLSASVESGSTLAGAESISATISNYYDIALAAGNGSNNCEVFTIDREGKKQPTLSKFCYQAFTNNLVITAGEERQYSVSFEKTSANSWLKLGNSSVALIPQASNLRTATPGNDNIDYMIPVAVDVKGGAISGYLRVESKEGTYIVVDFQPSGNPASKSYPLSSGNVFYLGAYVVKTEVESGVQIRTGSWEYLANATYTIPDNYDAKANPVVLTSGPISGGSPFAFVVAGITGYIDIGESVTYSY